ncbi:MAG: hypothetical protein AB8G17_13425 [Gammaproteobacteria bacterium]
MLKGAAASGTAAALRGGFNAVHANWGANELLDDFDGSELINRPHAYRVLDELGLDGLIAFDPVNVFYLGNFLGYNVKIQTRAPSFAVFPRHHDKPTVLVVGFGDLWSVTTGPRRTPDVIPYSMPVN